MAENSSIEWTTHTFNPWLGCTKVAPGCTHCYAEALMDRRYGKVQWGPNGTRVLTSPANWKLPLKWNREADPLKHTRKLKDPIDIIASASVELAYAYRPRVFCASLSDVFEDWPGPILNHKGEQMRVERFANPDPDIDMTIPATMDHVRQKLFALIDATPNLDWLLLTKRPENVRRMWPARFRWVETGVKIWQLESPIGSRRFCGIVWGDSNTPHWSMPGGYSVVSTHAPTEEHECGECLTVDECKTEVERRSGTRPNCWLGTSIATQADADRNIPELLACRDLSPLLFVSAEPLVEAVDLRRLIHGHCQKCGYDDEGPWEKCNRCGHKRKNMPPLRRLEDGNYVADLNWLIIGGESGPHARPCNIAWIRSLKDQAQAADVACFVKQLGSHVLLDGPEVTPPFGCRWTLKDSKGGDPSEWRKDLQIRQFPKAEAAHA